MLFFVRNQIIFENFILFVKKKHFENNNKNDQHCFIRVISKIIRIFSNLLRIEKQICRKKIIFVIDHSRNEILNENEKMLQNEKNRSKF